MFPAPGTDKSFTDVRSAVQKTKNKAGSCSDISSFVTSFFRHSLTGGRKQYKIMQALLGQKRGSIMQIYTQAALPYRSDVVESLECGDNMATVVTEKGSDPMPKPVILLVSRGGFEPPTR